MNLAFWKRDATSAANADAAPPGDEPADADSANRAPGLFARIAALAKKRRKEPVADEQDATLATPPRAASVEVETPMVAGVRSKKRLLLGVATGVALLLLASGGLLAWKLTATTAMHEPVAHRPPAEQPTTSEQRDDAMQKKLAALKKENQELATQLEALKKEKTTAPQQEVPEPTKEGAAPATAAPTGQSEVVLSGKDPKAAAQALKKAIEEMNASSGDRPRNADK